MQEYRHIFLDQTSAGILSSQQIQTGGGENGESNEVISTGSVVLKSVGKKATEEIAGQIVDQPLNQVTGGLWTPIKTVGKSLVRGVSNGFGGAALAGLAGAGTIVAIKGVELLVQYLQDRVAKLESEAKEENNADNLLIKSGKLNVLNSTITYNRYGKANYTDRS